MLTFFPSSLQAFFFFFQAEDGIRGFHVTGVQTCALPICARWPRAAAGRRRVGWDGVPLGRPTRRFPAREARARAASGLEDADGRRASAIRRSRARKSGTAN